MDILLHYLIKLFVCKFYKFVNTNIIQTLHYFLYVNR